jgi:hypothetical protein
MIVMGGLLQRYRSQLARTTRARAFGVHLAVSGLIVAMVCALVFLFWYPYPFFEMSGTWQVLRILIGVDLILGPVLTLIVFKPSKPSLVFDLGVIAAIQIAALIYGTVTIYTQRPYFAVFAVDRFEILARTDVDTDSIANPALREKPWRGPVFVAAVRPDDPVAYQRLLEETLFEGLPDIQQRPEFWDVLAAHRDLVTARAESLEDFRSRRPDAAAAVEHLERSYGDRSIGLLPGIGRAGIRTFVIDLESGKPIDSLALDYWRDPAKDREPPA